MSAGRALAFRRRPRTSLPVRSPVCRVPLRPGGPHGALIPSCHGRKAPGDPSLGDRRRRAPLGMGGAGRWASLGARWSPGFLRCRLLSGFAALQLSPAVPVTAPCQQCLFLVFVPGTYWVSSRQWPRGQQLTVAPGSGWQRGRRAWRVPAPATLLPADFCGSELVSVGNGGQRRGERFVFA